MEPSAGSEDEMKKLILLVLVIGALAGAFMAVRWFRGDSEYEEALREFEEQETDSEQMHEQEQQS
jgi:flagellar basal body-associated protein FliL